MDNAEGTEAAGEPPRTEHQPAIVITSDADLVKACNDFGVTPRASIMKVKVGLRDIHPIP